MPAAAFWCAPPRRIAEGGLVRPQGSASSRIRECGGSEEECSINQSIESRRSSDSVVIACGWCGHPGAFIMKSVGISTSMNEKTVYFSVEFCVSVAEHKKAFCQLSTEHNERDPMRRHRRAPAPAAWRCASGFPRHHVSHWHGSSSPTRESNGSQVDHHRGVGRPCSAQGLFRFV